MFEQYSQTEIIEKKKWVKLIMNGKPSTTFIHIYTKLKPKELLKAISAKWGFKIEKVRLFSVEGVEYEINDLQYLKDKESLYASKGQEYASNQNFGEYQVLKQIGQGGFGKVSLAKNINTEEQVAIKVLRSNRMKSAMDIDMIFRQAQNMKALNHPHIVKIHNCYTLKQMKMVVVMQYMEGGQLLGLLKKKKKFKEQEAKHYFRQLISAISYCHRRNIVHRDLKLQNILITENISLRQQSAQEISADINQEFPTIKVSDFGISGVANKLNEQIDTGTLKYMAPQVLSKKQKINSFAIDVWACGVILFYMVCGKLPFQGSKQSEIIGKILKGKFILPDDLSDGCKQMIKQMLKVQPKKRTKIWQIQSDPWLSKNHQNRRIATQYIQNHFLQMGSDQIIEYACQKSSDFQERSSVSSPIQIKSQSTLQSPVYAKSHINFNQKMQKSHDLLISKAHPSQKNLLVQQRKRLSPNLPIRKKQKHDTSIPMGSSIGIPKKSPNNFSYSKQLNPGQMSKLFFGLKKPSPSSSLGAPKRLQKEKLQIAQEIQSYHIRYVHKKPERTELNQLPSILQVSPTLSKGQTRYFNLQKKYQNVKQQQLKNMGSIQQKYEAKKLMKITKKDSNKQ